MKRSIAFIFLPLVVGGCSLINSLDDVVEGSTSAVTSSGGSTATAVGGMGGSTTTAQGAGGGGSAAAPEGLIVVGGVVNQTNGSGVLVALDGDTGAELNREGYNEMHPQFADKQVLAVAYDGHPTTSGSSRDHWYIFSGSGFPVDPSTTATLEVRTFDRSDNTWTTVHSLDLGSLAPIAPTDVIVLKDRLVFTAYDSQDFNSINLVVVSTDSAPQIVTQEDITPNPVDSLLLGINGYASQQSIGGVVNVMMQNSGQSPNCFLELRLVNVNQNSTNVTNTTTSIGTVLDCGGGQPAAVAWNIDHRQGNVGVIAFPPPPNEPSNGSVITYNMSTQMQITTAPTTMNGLRILDLEMSPCQNTAMFVEHLVDQAMFAVSIDSEGIQATGSLGHQGQRIYYEPFSGKALDFFDGGDNNLLLQAFTLAGTDLAPTLTKAQPPAWVPPTDVRPRVVATRLPLPFDCN